MSEVVKISYKRYFYDKIKYDFRDIKLPGHLSPYGLFLKEYRINND